MMKKILIIFTIAHPLFSFNLVYKDGFQTKFNAAESKKIDAVLNKYEWPSSVNLVTDTTGKKIKSKNLQVTDLFTASPDAEMRFIANELKNISQALQVMWIPQTLWDLLVIVHKHEQDFLSEGFKARQEITSSALKILNQHGVNLGPDTDLTEQDYEKIVAALLKRLQKPGRGNIDRKLKTALIAESKMLAADSSAILASLKQEEEARQHNKVLLYRTTNGIALNAKNTKDVALDFVIPSSEKPPTILGAVKNLKNLVKPGKNKDIDLSYQYSLFGGCLNDVHICPYYYYGPLKYKILYVLSLDREQVHNQTKQLLYFPAFSPSLITFNEGILGHPRLRIIGPFSRPLDQYLGGQFFKFGFYTPLNDPLFDNIANPKERQYLSFLYEAATMLAHNTIVVSSKEDHGSDDGLLKAQEKALQLLKTTIEALRK